MQYARYSGVLASRPRRKFRREATRCIAPRAASKLRLGLGLGLGLGLAGLLGCNTGEASGPVAEAAASEATLEHLPYYDNAQFDPRWLDGDPAKLDGFHTIRDFELTNQDGETITAETFAGKIYVADFIFTSCPSLCPKMTEAMAELQATFAEDDDVLFLSHSVTPDIDTPEVLHEYAARNGVISGKWHLATGERALIYELGRNFYFVEEDLGRAKSDDDFLHTDNFVLIDRGGHLRGIYSSLSRAEMRRLAADITMLENEEGSA
ncbi:hypothetical protein ENSA5_46300 [Enhygromyxa salina]|uniref:Thioredoxin domain-containing protein n=1 Tax=Enhygromyxa salina TaxID=215803 RepID=A0A2S9XJD8_9BACT|nr:hypothetical protein ENSA5_46300 [Enhygromyxa salina]